MKWVKFNSLIPITPHNGNVIPEGSHFMMPDNQIEGIVEMGDKANVEITDIDQARVYRGGAISAKAKVAFYYPAGIGDAACHTAIVAKFKDKHPDCDIRVFASHQSAPIWFLNPSVGKVARAGWPSWDSMHLCDVWLLGDAVTYKDDQSNIYDCLSKHFCMTLSENQQRPWLFVSKEEADDLYVKLHRLLGRDISKDAICLFCPMASKVNRSWHPTKWSTIVRQIQEKLGYLVVALGSREQAPEFARLHGLCAVLAGGLTEREMIVMANIADRIVTVDSAMLHIAAGLDIPTVGLFGSFSPKQRSSTYVHCKNIWPNRFCKNSPCSFHNSGFPIDKCPTTNPTSCAVLDSIEPQAVVDELKFMEQQDRIISCNPVMKIFKKA